MPTTAARKCYCYVRTERVQVYDMLSQCCDRREAGMPWFQLFRDHGRCWKGRLVSEIDYGTLPDQPIGRSDEIIRDGRQQLNRFVTK